MGKTPSKFSEVLSLDVHFSPVLMPFSFFLLVQSFSWDHTEGGKSLRARVVEAERQRDAAIQEALKNSEAMKNLETAKKECNGMASSFRFLLYLNLPFF